MPGSRHKESSTALYGSTPFQRWQRLHSGRSVSSGREASQPIVRQIASAIAVLWNGWGSGEVNGGSIAFAWAERRLPLRKRGAAARILSDVPAMPCHAMPRRTRHGRANRTAQVCDQRVRGRNVRRHSRKSVIGRLVYHPSFKDLIRQSRRRHRVGRCRPCRAVIDQPRIAGG